MQKLNKVELNKELKQKIEEMLRLAYRKVGYRTEGEIELNIRGVFMDKYTMEQEDVVIGGKEYKDVLMIPIATDLGIKRRMNKKYNDEDYGEVLREFDHSHQQTLCLMVNRNGDVFYVLRNYDYYDDWYYLEYSHCENDVFKVVDIEQIDFTKFKPKDYYVKTPPLSQKLIDDLGSKLDEILKSFVEENTDIIASNIANCIQGVVNGYLTSVLVDDTKYEQIYTLPLAYYFPPNYEDGGLSYGQVSRYGKSYCYEQQKELALLVGDDVRLVELMHTVYEELDGDRVVIDSCEFCDYQAKILNSLNEINLKDYNLFVNEWSDNGWQVVIDDDIKFVDMLNIDWWCYEDGD
jgi:hypothetical protein